jgi:hypothetical protein
VNFASQVQKAFALLEQIALELREIKVLLKERNGA